MEQNSQNLQQSKQVRINDSDDYITMAEKIYHHFQLNQSCTIRGIAIVDKDPYPKGKMVLYEIEQLDKKLNYKNGKRRKRVKPPNSVGDFIAGKIFRYEERIQDKKIVYLIWRKQ